jgi:hypothetical protein
VSTVWHGFLFGVGFGVAAGLIAGVFGYVMLELIGRAVTRWRSKARGWPSEAVTMPVEERKRADGAVYASIEPDVD